MAAQPPSAPRDFTRTRHSSYDLISPLKLDLSGKYAVATGAAWDTGVGFATAKAFARVGVAEIAVVDLHGVSDNLVADLKQVAKEAGRDEQIVISCTTDIANATSVRAAYDKVVAAFSGRLDVLVNNAAHMEPYERFLDADPDIYWRTWQVNLGGLFNMARAVLPMMLSARESGDGLCTMGDTSCAWDMEELLQMKSAIIEEDKVKLKMAF
ncbi:hypothetical protein VD0004_g3168 [Verticillium dahliae]|uniref:3-oxoacyl-[acyl-carrier-protein] reductase n=1 Tax=Verticillium dahliae TaxID=27337 RepID=A0A444RQN5_VERDA|nr:hypothetical protein VdG1_06176 [Verticillium dahliae VDG1]PNH44503.1 hypothetical protein VD0004_g3168 [Verticillium dahliae]RXG43470.1 hypothetical protein VDGE_30735 [Verticillium dahliae]